MNKKGNIDPLYILIGVFTVAICILVINKVVFEFNNSANSTAELNSTRIIGMMAQGTSAINLLDYVFVFIIIGLTLSTIILAFMIRTHPALFFISLITLGVVIFLSAIFSNIFTSISLSTQFTNSTIHYPIMTEVMDNLPKWILVIGIVVAIVFYAKTKYYEGGL